MLLASERNGVSVQTRRLLVLDVESFWCQRSELKDPISFPQLPPFPAVVISRSASDKYTGIIEKTGS